MRKSPRVVAPALVFGALLLGTLRLTGLPSPAQFMAQAAAQPILTVPPSALSTQAQNPTQRPEDLATPLTLASAALAGAQEVTATLTPAATETPVATPETAATTAPPVVVAPPEKEPTATQIPTATEVPATLAPEPTATALPAPTSTTAPTAVPTAALQPPSRIVAPAVGLDAKVVTVGWHEVTDPDGSTHTEWDVASYAAGWQKNSVKPGATGNIVISGHNNIEGEVFRNLEKFQPGDQITLYAGNRSFTYVVTEKFVVADKNVPYAQRLENARWIGPFPDSRLTLVSCWPPTNNTHRMFIIAKPKDLS